MKKFFVVLEKETNRLIGVDGEDGAVFFLRMNADDLQRKLGDGYFVKECSCCDVTQVIV